MRGKNIWASALLAGGILGIATPASADEEVKTPEQWHAQYLVLQGENHLPVAEAFSTPFVTFYRIDGEGYIPSTPMGKVNEESACYQQLYIPDHVRNDESNSSVSTAKDEAAAISASSDVARKAREWYESEFHCPRDLGAVEAGSYVFSEDGNSLAGVDFSAPIHPFEVVSLNGERFIVFPEGGDKTRKDPAIKPMRFSGLALKRHPEASDDDNTKLKIKPYIPGAPNLPTLVTYDTIDDLADDQSLQDDIEKLENDIAKIVDEAMERLKKVKPPQADAKPDTVLMVVRSPAETDADTKKRIDEALKRIQKKIDGVLKNRAKLTTVSFGNELPICSDGSETCWSLNRSAALYISR